MSAEPGTVSIIRGRLQGPALQFVTVTAWILGGLGAFTDTKWARLAGLIAIVLVTTTPLIRVMWLMLRWLQEGDYAFLWRGAGLLAVAAVGGVVAFFWLGI